MKPKSKGETIEDFLKRGGQITVLAPWTRDHEALHQGQDVSRFTQLGQMAEALLKAQKRGK